MLLSIWSHNLATGWCHFFHSAGACQLRKCSPHVYKEKGRWALFSLISQICSVYSSESHTKVSQIWCHFCEHKKSGQWNKSNMGQFVLSVIMWSQSRDWFGIFLHSKTAVINSSSFHCSNFTFTSVWCCSEMGKCVRVLDWAWIRSVNFS